jgi:hypothetical protein
MALIGLLAASLCACGGSTHKASTKAEFLRRANANCVHPSKDAAAVRREFAAASTPALKAKLYEQKVLPRFEQELDQIAKLKPPAADRDRVNGIVELARRDARDFAAKLVKDPKAALARRAQPFATSSAAASAYGLKICVD